MESNHPQSYAGETRHNLDSKGRLTVPAKYRPEEDSKEEYLALFQSEGFIQILPPARGAVVIERMNQLKLGDRKGRKTLMRLMRNAETFTLDKTGRINLNKALYEKAGIGKEVMIVGMGASFGLWDPERFEAYMAKDEEEDFDIDQDLLDLDV